MSVFLYNILIPTHQNIMQRKIITKAISKFEGKALNATHPQYICCTEHKRHYYIEESCAALKVLEEFRAAQPKPYVVYPNDEE